MRWVSEQKIQDGPRGVGYVPDGVRQQVQESRFRCWDFSWRVQSCFVEKEAVAQKVHWKWRGFVEADVDASEDFEEEVVLLWLAWCRLRRRSWGPEVDVKAFSDMSVDG